jgi:ADP-heptose:LPS heptosyltransferase
MRSRLPEWKNTRHEVYYYLNLVDAIEQSYFGAVTETTDLEPRIEVPSEKLVEAQRLISAGDARTIILAPGSTNSRAKRWLPENFASLNDRLQRELGAKVLLLGSKGDAEVSQRVIELSLEKPLDLTGDTDIETAAALLQQSRSFSLERHGSRASRSGCRNQDDRDLRSDESGHERGPSRRRPSFCPRMSSVHHACYATARSIIAA